MSSSMFHLQLLLKIRPDDVLYDFLARCGLPVRFGVAEADDDVSVIRRIVAAIECAPSPVRDCVLASLHRISLLADEAGLEALRAVNEAHSGPVNALHLPDAPAQCALWMYLRHRDLFDEALRLRGLHAPRHEPMPLDTLRQPLLRPDALVVDHVRLLEATLLDETTGGEIAVRAPEGNPRFGVLDLLDHWMPTDNPMRQGRFRLIAAKLGIEFFPEPGQTIGRSVLVALRRRDSNLGDFDSGTRTQLEAWLHHWRLAPGFDLPAVPPFQTPA
ncbi:hypothetical protein [Pseudoxanthomonas mexicana]